MSDHTGVHQFSTSPQSAQDWAALLLKYARRLAETAGTGLETREQIETLMLQAVDVRYAVTGLKLALERADYRYCVMHSRTEALRARGAGHCG